MLAGSERRYGNHAQRQASRPFRNADVEDGENGRRGLGGQETSHTLSLQVGLWAKGQRTHTQQYSVQTPTGVDVEIERLGSSRSCCRLNSNYTCQSTRGESLSKRSLEGFVGACRVPLSLSQLARRREYSRPTRFKRVARVLCRGAVRSQDGRRGTRKVQEIGGMGR